jgi:hypothetical protein
MIADMNGGISKLGFKKSHFEQDFKVKPDYITESLFAARRTDIPTLKFF